MGIITRAKSPFHFKNKERIEVFVLCPPTKGLKVKCAWKKVPIDSLHNQGLCLLTQSLVMSCQDNKYIKQMKYIKNIASIYHYQLNIAISKTKVQQCQDSHIISDILDKKKGKQRM